MLINLKKLSLKKMMRYFCIVIMILTSTLYANLPRHGLTLNVGGSAALYEFEYQYRFMINDKHTLSANVALSSAAINIGFPMGINYTYGQNNQLLLGLRFIPDVLLLSFDEEVVVPLWNYILNLRVGYGRELVLFKHDFTLYAFASPLLNLNSGKILPWAGIGLTQYF